MELFLNLLWVWIAVTVLLVWRIRWAHQLRQTRYTPLQQWAAFACALAFLFFVVSLSDDLHTEEAVLDAVGRRTVMLVCSSHWAHGGSHQPVGAANVSKRFLTADPHWPHGLVVLGPEIQFFSVEKTDSPGRSPPRPSQRSFPFL